MKIKALIVMAIISCLTPLGAVAEDRNILLKTPGDAVKLGQSIAEIVYGQESSNRQQPYTAQLDGDVWVVRGTLHADKGGVAEVKLNRFDGAMVQIKHGK